MPHPYELLEPGDLVLDDFPESLTESLAERDRIRAEASDGSDAYEYAIADLQKWPPGSRVTVAFRGGSDEVRRSIENATREITEACDIVLDFRDAKGAFRTWSEKDTKYAAHIRVSFDQGGYWSLVGTDSVDPNVGRPGDPSGGRPNQRSLNLGGFDLKLPLGFEGTARHEFLHALGFHHEHQNLRGPCQEEFRWDDDPGYVRTTDPRGMYVPDDAGRRPGIYTYLSGYPNRWSKQKIDFNLRSGQASNVTYGPFDTGSVMLYRFPPLFYKRQPNPCAPSGDGRALSDGDRAGLRSLYGPARTPAKYAESLATVRAAMGGALEGVIESAASTGSEWLDTLEGIVAAGPLDGPRSIWKYDFAAMAGLASTDGVPRPDRPSATWLAKVGRRVVQLADNEIEVRTWWAQTSGQEAVSDFDPDAERAAQDDFVEKFAPWDEELALEAVPVPIDEDAHAELTSEVDARIAEIFGPGMNAAGSEEGLFDGAVAAVKGVQGRPSAEQDYKELFRTSEVALPAISATWDDDATFAWLRLAGPNAGLLRCVDGLPPNLKLDDARYKAAVGDAADRLDAAAAEGRLFVCDYEVLGRTLINNPPKQVWSPIALFASSKGKLVPVAITCGQDPSKFPVFTPQDGLKWGLAKQVVQVADGNHHEIVSHLGRTHLYVEVYLLATRRELAPSHPINRLLVGHFEGTVFINNAARTSLIAPNGAIDHIFAGKIESAQGLAAEAVRSYDFMAGMIPAVLSGARTETIKVYPYRDDARLLWNTIHDWVAAYVGNAYANDAAVGADTQLAGWVGQLRKPVPQGGLPGFPTIQTRAVLADVLTQMIFIPSCQHAAVNFPQLPLMSYSPAVTGSGWRDAPGTAPITDQDRLDFMPPLELAMQQLDVLELLGAIHHTKLGDYRSNAFPYDSLFIDPKVVKELLPAFRKALAAAEDTIGTRNQTRAAYEFLRPSLVPMSINI